MDQRLVRFFIIASVAFLLTTLLQPLLFPPKQKPDAAKVAGVDKTGDASGKKPAEAADSPADAGKDAQQDPNAEAAASATENQAPAPRPVHPNRLVTLGTYGADSPDKLVVTLNSRGAAIHRILLNARTKKSHLRYRDLESNGVFVGPLEPTMTATGCRVNCVTPGTPAAVAGMQVGDLITHVGDEPVVSAADLIKQFDQFQPGAKIPIRIVRGESTAPATLDVSVTAEQIPLEVVGPRSGQLYDPDGTIPESMLVTLRQMTAGEWPELDAWMRSADWQVAETTRDGARVIEFSLDIPASTAAGTNGHGALRAIKRFWLPTATSNEDFAANFHVVMEVEFQNLSPTPQSLAYEVMGPTGTNIEGWWYQNKIHGRSSALFHVAGARDLVSSNVQRPFYFWGGPEIVKNFTSTSPELQEVFSPNVTPPEAKAMRYAGVDTQYFAVALLPFSGSHPPPAPGPNTFQPYSAFTHVLDSRESVGRNSKMQRTVDLTFRLFSNEIKLPAAAPAGEAGAAAASYRQAFEIFAGPKESQLLQEYGLSDLISYGWFAWVSRPLVGFLRFFYGIFGNYGIAIVLLTICVRLAIFPISRRAQMNAARHAKMMQILQPEIKKIQEKYKDNLEKRSKAQNELFRRYNYSPFSMFGGCLLMFLQLPIFIGLYRGLSVDIALRGQPLIPGIRWCSNLAGPDQLLYWKNWLPFGMGDETGLFGPYLNILPLVTIALFLVQTKLFSPPPTDDQQRMAQRVMTLTMAFMGVLFFKVPAGLCIYFITSSVWGILERQFIPKPQLPNAPGELSHDVSSESGDSGEGARGLATLNSDKERESRRRLDKDRQRRLRESQQ